MKPSRICSAIHLVTLTLVSSVAFGQDGALEEITVTGSSIRDSLASAIATKRDANNVMDVIAADTIGRFPDQNLADSLGRVPGLAIERDQGQARYINFRGTPFRYTSIGFDGINILGAENGRIPRFDAFPSTITRAIEANKAITPDLPGESIAGYIDIKTFDPLMSKGLHMSGEAGYGQQSLGDQDIDRYNGKLSYSDDTFGAVVFGSHDLRGRITDNRELELEQNSAGQLVVNNLDFRSYRGERENNSWGGRLDFAPSGQFLNRVFVSTLYSEFIDREERNQFDFDFAAPIAGVSASNQPLSVTRTLEDGEYESSTFTNTLGADFALGQWESTARLNYTKTENNTFLPLIQSGGLAGFGSYDLNDLENPVLTLSNAGGQTLDPNTGTYGMNLGLVFNIGMETDAVQFKYDMERPTRLFGTDTIVKLGTRVDFRDGSGGDALQVGGFPAAVNINSFVTPAAWDTDMANGIGGRNYDNVGLRDAWENAVGGINAPFASDTLIEVEENVYAVYAMATTTLGWGEVTYGVRTEFTDFETSGQVSNQAVTVSNDYVNVLPSVNASIDLNDEVKLRLAATTGISRPSYQELRASATADVTQVPPTLSGGNPYLEEEKSVGLDASLEWYYSTTGLLSAGMFYRAIDNVIYSDSSVIPDGSSYAPGLIAPGTPTVLNSFFNGDDGELRGLEFNVITEAPVPFEGLGFQGNITFLDSEFSAPTQGGRTYGMPGTSDLIYNASVYYEKYGLSARLNFMYRDDWLSTTENTSLTEYWAEQERLDLSLRYVVPGEFAGASLTLFANANNLTDAVDVRYANTPLTPNQAERYGRHFMLGLRMDY